MYRLILTNRKYSFENSNFFEMLKITFHKEQPKKRIYREYKTFPLETFSSGSFLSHKRTMTTKHLKKTFLKPSIIKLQKCQKFFEVVRSLILMRLYEMLL